MYSQTIMAVGDRDLSPGSSNTSGNSQARSSIDGTGATTSNAHSSQEDEVDMQLWKLDGKIKRDRDSKL